MRTVFLMSIVFTMLLACGTTNKNTSERAIQLHNMVENKSFEIVSNRAYPLMTSAMQQLDNMGLFVNGSTAASIDISTHGNFLRMKNDSVMANLPFYGERQMGGGYNNASGIEFKGIPRNLQINKLKEQSYEIRFNIHDTNSSTESYEVYIKLAPNLTSNIVVRSSHRSNIQFSGRIRELK